MSGAPVVPYPGLSPAPSAGAAPVGTTAPTASPGATDTTTPVAAGKPAYPLPDTLARTGTPEQQGAWQDEMFKRYGPPSADGTPAGATSTGGFTTTTNPDGSITVKDANGNVIYSSTPTATAVDPTVAQGQSAYEQIWGVTPPHGYIEKLVKAGFNVFQIQLHELSMPGANRTQYWRDNEASVAKAISNIMGRR